MHAPLKPGHRLSDPPIINVESTSFPLTPAPMLTDEPYIGWSELVGFAFVSFMITIGIGAIAIVLWLLLTVVAFPADIVPPAPWLPDPTTTPGAINASITTAMLCAKGYRTGTVRPDADYTERLKAEQLLSSDDYTDHNRRHYEEDHLVPLELGGHPSDPKNLWPEYWNGRCGAHIKDKLETALHVLVCAGNIGLAEAQGEIATDWVRAYNLHIGPLVCP